MDFNVTSGNTTEVNRTGDCFGRSPGPGEANVTWQSAWFAIAAVAMNSISPIICLFDAVELTLFWLLAVLLTGESPRIAARRVARVRFRDTMAEIRGQCQENAEQSLTQLRSRFCVAQAAFAVAALT
ncbi:uncharacterized protein PG986_010639 [Apiospora aurea]|uniref:Uncharacterized protein n=1 Tax=Apiospora aurea TaxID=335848 RepID=A0ABR1Q2T5_9PEZI